MLFLKRIKTKLIDYLRRERPPEQFPLSNFERLSEQILPGDVILVEGRSRVSDVIRVTMQSTWTHAALYIGRLKDVEDLELRNKILKLFSERSESVNTNVDKLDLVNPYSVKNDLDISAVQLLIESVLGKGTVITPLTQYRYDHMRICRPKGITEQDIKTVIKFAIGRLGIEYGVRHIFDLMRFYFPWTFLPRRWRSTLFEQHIDAPTQEICSSMIADAFMSVNFPILPAVKRNEERGIVLYKRNPKLFTPKDFDYSPYFEIIKYPFFEIEEHTSYRDLPWSDEIIVND